MAFDWGYFAQSNINAGGNMLSSAPVVTPQTANTVQSAVSTTISNAKSIGNQLLDWAKAELPNIANAALAATAACTFTGSMGNISQLSHPYRINMSYVPVVDIDYNRNGHPVMAMHRIDTLKGFVLVEDGDLDLNATEYERQAVQNLLESGFYYE